MHLAMQPCAHLEGGGDLVLMSSLNPKPRWITSQQPGVATACAQTCVLKVHFIQCCRCQIWRYRPCAHLEGGGDLVLAGVLARALLLLARLARPVLPLLCAHDE